MSSGGLSSKPAQYGVWVARVSNGRSSEQLPAGNVLSGFDSRTLHHFLPFLSFLLGIADCAKCTVGFPHFCLFCLLTNGHSCGKIGAPVRPERRAFSFCAIRRIFANFQADFLCFAQSRNRSRRGVALHHAKALNCQGKSAEKLHKFFSQNLYKTEIPRFFEKSS